MRHKEGPLHVWDEDLTGEWVSVLAQDGIEALESFLWKHQQFWVLCRERDENT